MIDENADIPDSEHKESTDRDGKIAKEEANRLASIASQLYGDAFEDEGVLDEEAAERFIPFLESGESILLANKMRVARTGCLSQVLNMQDDIYHVSLTNKRVLLNKPTWPTGKPSSKVKEYPFDQLFSIHQQDKHWVLTTKKKEVVPLYESDWVSGKGASNLLRAMFAFFYDRSKTLVISPKFQDQDIQDAVRYRQITVIIDEDTHSAS